MYNMLIHNNIIIFSNVPILPEQCAVLEIYRNKINYYGTTLC